MLSLVLGYLVCPLSWPLGTSGVHCGKKDEGHFQPWPRWNPLSTSHHPEAWLSAFCPTPPPALQAPMVLRCRCWKLGWISLDLIATPGNYTSKIKAASHTVKGKFTNRFSFPGKHDLCLSSFIPILSNNSKILISVPILGFWSTSIIQRVNTSSESPRAWYLLRYAGAEGTNCYWDQEPCFLDFSPAGNSTQLFLSKVSMLTWNVDREGAKAPQCSRPSNLH